MQLPLVSVICLSYNHQDYVVASLNSVLKQSYAAIELIVVDDASTDQSQEIIRNFLKDKPHIPFLALKKNVGNCAAFNKALTLATGKYVVDLAADDLLLPNRIEKQVNLFESLPEQYGVVFSDAELINETGEVLKNYYLRDSTGQLLQEVPSGNVYKNLIKQAFICTPTMMIRKSVLDKLDGYDASLSYEDYDFWVRSGREYLYQFQDEILTQKRLLSRSHRLSFYKKKKNPHLESTLKVCKKAFSQNQNTSENQSLAVSVRYHMRQSLYMEMYPLAIQYATLLKKIDQLTLIDQFVILLSKLRLPIHWLYSFYLSVRKQ